MFLRPTEAAQMAGLSTRAIYRAIERGDLRAVRLCSRLRIARADFDDWVERSVVETHSAPPWPAPVLPVTPARGSFRRLLADDRRAAP